MNLTLDRDLSTEILPFPPATPREIPHVALFGVDIHVARMPAVVECLHGWMREAPVACRYVVTPNVDHIVMLDENVGLQAAYKDAALVLADGWPVVAASRLLGKPLPSRVAGSDLVPALFDAATPESSLRVFLLGAAPGVADIAAERIHDRWPNVRVVGTYSPPLGFEHDTTENEEILARISAAGPDLLVLGLGAPKQELWVHRHQSRIDARIALCVGATIDFLAGHRHRAPRWMQHCGVEWLHRLLSEPRRMTRRYARDAVIFPRLVWRQYTMRNG